MHTNDRLDRGDGGKGGGWEGAFPNRMEVSTSSNSGGWLFVCLLFVLSCKARFNLHHGWLISRDASICLLLLLLLSLLFVPTRLPSCGGDVVVYSFDINQPSLPTPFYPVLVSISVSMALFAVIDSINSPDNSPLSHSVLPVFFLPDWFFQLYIYIILCG